LISLGIDRSGRKSPIVLTKAFCNSFESFILSIPINLEYNDVELIKIGLIFAVEILPIWIVYFVLDELYLWLKKLMGISGIRLGLF